MRSVFCGAYTGKTLLAGYVVEGENECMDYKETILIVDDSALNRMVFIEILGKENYTFLEAENGQQAVELLDCHPEVDLLLLDITMPEIDGFGVLEAMNQYHWIEETPVIMISAEDSYTFVERAYDLGASDYITRPFDARVVCRRVSNTLMLYAKQKRLVQMVAEQVYEKEKVSNTMISILSHIVEFRNNESGLHVVHIRTITELLLRWLRKKTDRYPLTEADISLISTASALHDIGKINIPEQILNKPGRLTKEEFEIIKTHSAVGEHMLRQIPFNQNEPLVKVAREICRWHHERWDGRGYPDGLKGDEIPISAQVVSLADVYDALTSERCYKAAFDHETALSMIVNGECGAFNPLLLECLMDGADQKRKSRRTRSRASARRLTASPARCSRKRGCSQAGRSRAAPASTGRTPRKPQNDGPKIHGIFLRKDNSGSKEKVGYDTRGILCKDRRQQRGRFAAPAQRSDGAEIYRKVPVRHQLGQSGKCHSQPGLGGGLPRCPHPERRGPEPGLPEAVSLQHGPHRGPARLQAPDRPRSARGRGFGPGRPAEGHPGAGRLMPLHRKNLKKSSVFFPQT